MTVLEKRFKKHLIDKEVTQKSVADHFGWTSQYLRQLMAGKTMGPAADKNLQSVKDYLGMK
ncbi:helix-turn-helix domain-containing protein [Levilactobacillus senmaizukei]|uniref:helix-turn-helix domain-containing protein n=1 Tax=Levilactobacillus senmaizukei TaxID=431273 RepID=UPI00077BAD71|nr:helix-turn-helix transcriptional regulator [Levilactobacillus senmaizukei]